MTQDKQVRPVKIKVSDLTRYFICPRLVYFSARGEEEAEKPNAEKPNANANARGRRRERSVIENILLKELAFSLKDKICGEGEDDEGVKEVIQEVVESVEWLYKEELRGVEKDFLEEVKRDFVCGVVGSWERSSWEGGSWEGGSWEEWWERIKNIRGESELLELECAFGCEREHLMVSEKLGLSGSVDKLIRAGEEFVPCVVKTGRCPEYGVWRGDRMQLAAYAMLVEEEFETTVRRGFVQYIKAAEFRESLVRRRDRALALQILRRVKRVKGKRAVFPEKGENAPCENCVFEEKCETRRTLLSKLLRKG